MLKLGWEDLNTITTGLMAYGIIKGEELDNYAQQLKDPSPLNVQGILFREKRKLEGQAKEEYLKERITRLTLDIAKSRELTNRVFSEQQRRLDANEYKD
jgi:hypothetical protein